MSMGLHVGSTSRSWVCLQAWQVKIWGRRHFVAMLSAHAEHTNQDIGLFFPLFDTRVASSQLKHPGDFYGRLVVRGSNTGHLSSIARPACALRHCALLYKPI
jgi:hypothetical protein